MTQRQNFFYFVRFFLIVGYYLLVAFPLVVSAAQVTLQWDANDQTVDGFNLYQRVDGQDYDYSSPVNTATITGTTYTVENLQAGTTYYFVVRAFAGGVESGDSNEVTYTPSAGTVDTDNDGWVDGIDTFPADPDQWLDTDADGISNSMDTDDDGDGMPDTWENQYGLNPLAYDADGDLDGDGVTNLNEYTSGTDPSFAPGNIPPDKPILAEPVDGATGVVLTPSLRTEAFSDANQDGHARTRYQIALGSDWDAMDNTDYVFDGEFTRQLTSLVLGELVLDPETTYYWRVKFYDDRNGESSWSATHHFTTMDNLTAGFMDDDGDGILNQQEIDDGDIDPGLVTDSEMIVVGTPDATNAQLALVHSSNADVVAVRAMDADSVEIGSSANRPAIMTDLIGFKLRLLGSEITASMTVYLSAPAPANAAWYKYNTEDGWVPFPYAVFRDDRRAVTIYLVDGGPGDDDGVQNGLIVDPSGLGYSLSGALDTNSQISNSSSSSDSNINGCFISLPMNEVSTNKNTIWLLILLDLLGMAAFIACAGILGRKQGRYR